jgi:hypothetical protein
MGVMGSTASVSTSQHLSARAVGRERLKNGLSDIEAIYALGSRHVWLISK